MKYLLFTVAALTLLGSTAVIAQFVGSNHQPQNITVHGNSTAAGIQAFNAQPGRDPNWAEGDVPSSEYLADRNMVSDWRANDLHRPPNGYRWFRLGNKFALVAIGSDTVIEVARDDRQAHADNGEN